MENIEIKGIRASRFIMSWVNWGEGGFGDKFREWLRQLVIDDEHLSEKEVEYIDRFSQYFCGKFELESDIRRFLRG